MTFKSLEHTHLWNDISTHLSILIVVRLPLSGVVVEQFKHTEGITKTSRTYETNSYNLSIYYGMPTRLFYIF